MSRHSKVTAQTDTQTDTQTDSAKTLTSRSQILVLHFPHGTYAIPL